MPDDLQRQADGYLQVLCRDIANRRVGSRGNHAATDYFAHVIAGFGFQVASPRFDCMDWRSSGATISTSNQSFEIYPGPYSLACELNASLVRITTVEELAGADVKDAILLLCGEIAREQLMPKNFPFYKPETHQRIIHGLEAARPGAVVAATSRSPALAGGVYPFPLIEDGDFTIPNAYMTDMEGERLARFIGAEFELAIDTVRRRSHGHIVIARKGPSAGERVVFMAHIDAKPGTPGALDNATGVATLLLLAELLADYDGALEIEIVAINGEDHYANPGERLYLEENRANFHDIILGVNLDGLGYIQGRTAYSLYGTTTELERSIQGVFARRKHLCPGQTWFQSDHALFVMHDRPAIALTSEHFTTLWSQIAHTPGDTVDLVSCDQLALTAICLRDLVQVIAAE